MATKELTQKQQKVIAGISLGIAIAVFILVVVFVGIPMVRFISVPDQFRDWVDVSGIWGRIAFVGMKTLKVVIAVIPGEPLELAAGYTFGIWEGMILCIIGTTLGSMITFLLVRTFGLSIVRVFFTQEKLDSLRFLKSSAKRDSILFILNIIPGTPKDLLNYFAGLTDMNFWVWMFVCSVGRVPSVIISTVCGDAFGQKRYTLAIIVLVATFVVGGIGIYCYNRIVAKGNSDKKTV